MLAASVVPGFSHAAAASRKGVSVRHMACSVTASFRASATLALRGPLLAAIALAQSLKRGPPRFLQKMAFAASNRHFRVNLSPRLDTRPFRLTSPDSWRRGVSPCQAPALDERRKRDAPPAAVTTAMAVIGPTPGAVISRRTVAWRPGRPP